MNARQPSGLAGSPILIGAVTVLITVVAVIAYLASPIDLVPDVLPIVGLLDDAILVAIVVRAVVRAAGRGVLAEHWRGPERSLLVLLRLCAVEA